MILLDCNPILLYKFRIVIRYYDKKGTPFQYTKQAF